MCSVLRCAQPSWIVVMPVLEHVGDVFKVVYIIPALRDALRHWYVDINAARSAVNHVLHVSRSVGSNVTTATVHYCAASLASGVRSLANGSVSTRSVGNSVMRCVTG